MQLNIKSSAKELLNWASVVKKNFFWESWNKNNSKLFWSSCTSYLSNEHVKGDADIVLVGNNKILPDNRKVTNVFNNYFQSITKNLDLFERLDEPNFSTFDEINRTINKFR